MIQLPNDTTAIDRGEHFGCSACRDLDRRHVTPFYPRVQDWCLHYMRGPFEGEIRPRAASTLLIAPRDTCQVKGFSCL